MPKHHLDIAKVFETFIEKRRPDTFNIEKAIKTEESRKVIEVTILKKKARETSIKRQIRYRKGADISTKRGSYRGPL